MPEMTYREAIAAAMRYELDTDPRSFIMGEDVGEYGGAYAVTKGFIQQYGPERIRNTPIAESVFTGAGVGAAMAGMRPIVEIMTINFSLVAMDQIVNHAAKLHQMSGGQVTVPLVIRTVSGGGAQLAAQHSQSFEHWYASVPGLIVAVPSTPADAKGLFRTAMLDPNPVMFIEHSLLYGMKGDVPEGPYEIPFGKADVKREGTDVTIVSYLRQTQTALRASAKLAQEGIECEVVDLRTLRPLDIDTVIESVKKTNRVLVVEETWQFGGFAGEIAFQIGEKAFDWLDGPVQRVAGKDVCMPYSKPLEKLALPTEEDVIQAVKGMV
jgi:pyruvate dehydrogenase E1 component beta subunit